MMFDRALFLLITSATVHQCVADEEASDNELPILLKQEFSTVEYGALEKRDTCPGGGRCIIGRCCGDGCAQNCCGHDEGGVGCGIAQRCNFDGNVFIGCCANLLGRCTGTPTMITINTPYRTVAINTDDTLPTTYAPAIPTADVTSGTGRSTDVDSSLSTASAASTRTTSTSTSSLGDISISTAVETSTSTSSEFGRSTSETTSSDASITSSSDFDSDSSSTADVEATETETASAAETTASSGAAGRTFGGMELGSLLAFGAWFLGTA
ncbi:hypothetical protein P170DRAFT_501700 [Aspergillus steynii IBT 23096]|uniref:GPI anchored protein n=1 Tax=Aspergillus steynii IBT 23096 TaxID=1392250 RepID=A0A2I2FVY7_9EURO|nr:uncharacterized protein P170DRAFT_501700 [Aspergillus steynii IBT 23096]PLB44813.1 hypothetical protein P170DRAFT_501700 [Aspergillus steynii IBT 23096]